jgi:hypothetical protein
MSGIFNNACRLQILLIVFFLLLGTSFHATSSESTEQTESILPESAEDECSCSVRKRQQVESRLKKKKQAEQE